MTKSELKERAINLSWEMQDADRAAWDRCNRQMAEVLNELDPLMSSTEAVCFYTFCENIAEKVTNRSPL